MGFLHRLGNDRARRDPIEAPLVGKGVLGPHAGNHGDGFFPLGSGLLGVDLEAVHFDEGGGPPGPQIHPAIADDIEHRRPFGDADRVIVLARQQGDGVANANPLGALGESPVEDFRGRTVGKLPQEMVLYRPEVLEPDLIGQFDLGHDLFVALLLDAVIVGFGYLNFIHEPEFHRHVLPRPGCLPMTAVAKLLVYPRCRWMNVVIFSNACRATDEERLRSSPSPSPSKTVTSIWPPAFGYWRTNSSRSGRGCASSYERARHNTGGVAVRSPRAKMRAGAPSAMASSVRQYWSCMGTTRSASPAGGVQSCRRPLA